MGETDVEFGTTVQPTSKLRICRTPGCLNAFDPKWRVKLQDEPAEMDNLCPACGAELTRNSFMRRAGDEGIFPHEEK
jgi:hypothetical protein